MNGSVYFKVDSINNGSTTYEDYSLDNESTQGKNPLVTRQQLYTTGGIVGFDQVESAKYIHIVNNNLPLALLNISLLSFSYFILLQSFTSSP